MKFIAKPYLFNNRNVKVFSDIKEAVKYLEDATGYKMDYEITNRKTKERTYDWELVGKLIRVKA
jgi:hypothetical protein